MVLYKLSFIYSFVIQVIIEKKLYSKLFTSNLRYFYMKITVTIIAIDSVTNSFLSFFCIFLQTKNKNQVFGKLEVC